ncbi:MAG: hypothetical protein JRH20_29890 [Deltaproteobacteria bacterium]|nr:hypothetical protein [Deltaproteobacteria bacterium]
MAIPIIYRDEMLVAIDKPTGSIVHRTRGAPPDSPILVDVLAQELGQRVFPVHRLDRQTSGVMVFALSSEVARRVAGDIQTMQWKKTYLGLCRGVITEPQMVDSPVREGDKRRPARTDVTPLEVYCNRYTFFRAIPHTGRRHQVRYHFRHLRHPLASDSNYGDGAVNRFFRQTMGLNRLFLRCPIRQRRVDWTFQQSWRPSYRMCSMPWRSMRAPWADRRCPLGR